MKIKQIAALLVCLFFTASTVYADMPGKGTGKNLQIAFTNVRSLGAFVLYVRDYSSTAIIKNDTVYNISAGGSVPHSIVFFAVNNGVVTDSVQLSDTEQRNIEITFTGVLHNELQFIMVTKAFENGSIQNTGTDGISASVKDFWKTNELLIGISLVVLMVLIVLFIWRKRKNKIDTVL